MTSRLPQPPMSISIISKLAAIGLEANQPIKPEGGSTGSIGLMSAFSPILPEEARSPENKGANE
jgi:hypothetical protein